MNTEGQVGVELRLVMDQLRKDVKTAAELLRTSLGQGADGAANSTDRAVKKMTELENQTRKTTRALKDQKDAMLDAWRKSIPPPNVSFGAQPTSGGHSSWSTTAGGGLATSAAGMFSGGGGAKPPVKPTGGGGGFLGGGGGILGTFAQIGAALAGLRVAIGLVKYAFDMLLAPLRAVAAAADAARKAYAASQLSGRPIGYSIAASAIGSALGVSQDDIMLFGEALKGLSDKMRYSIQVFQETNQPLTELGWNMKAMQSSFASLFSQIGAEMAPALMQAVSLIRNLTDALAKSTLVSSLTWLASTVIHVGAVIAGAVGIIAEAFDLIVQAVIDGVQYFVRQVKNSIARMTGGTIDSTDTFKETKDKADILARTVRDLFSRSANTASGSGPTGSANRMASSAWEKMGLILGPSAGMDANRETARNTRKMTWLLEQILNINQNGAPRGGYGSNPLTSAS